LPSLKREYTLDEIAMMTRWGPAKALGLHNQIGHLRSGAQADVVVYRKDRKPSEMFAEPELVFRRGQLVYRNGQILSEHSCKQHFEARPEYDEAIEKPLQQVWEDYYSVSMKALCTSME
jgi:formylmethanofuran dehydrogenase subunit A